MEGHFRSPTRIISEMKSSWESGTGGDSTPRGILNGLHSTADTDAQPSVSSYNPYPSRQAFITDAGYKQPAMDKQAPQTFPESNRQAVMSALKGLQTKIRQLELERGHAETNLKALSTETSRYRDLLNGTSTSIQQDESVNNEQQANLTMQTQEVDGQLEAAESRCALLERQLEYMRNVVRQSDTLSPQRQAATASSHVDQEQRDLRAQIDKISELERDHLRLSATQSIAENKIRDLEDKLREERHYRKVCQERAAGLESMAESARILAENTTGNIAKRPAKRKKKKVVKSKADPPTQSARDHYHLPESIPFITGKSVGESHSIPANVQRVLSLMKSHNSALCSPRGQVRSSSARAASATPSVRSSDLNELMLQLQDEFGQMSFEHAELSRQMSTTSNQPLREDLERELDSLTLRMELKGEQITKMRRHVDRLAAEKNKKKKKCNSNRAYSATPYSTSASTQIPSCGVVEVHTTIKSAGEVKTSKHVVPGSSHQAKSFLKSLKQIQTTLGKDDISWECC